MLEKDIERHLRDGVRNMGGLCLKMVCPGFTGMPDRIILLRGGVIAFAELKRPGQQERQRQQFVQHKLRKLGFPVFSSVDSWARVDEVLCWCAATLAGVDNITSGGSRHHSHKGKSLGTEIGEEMRRCLNAVFGDDDHDL